MLRLPHPMSQTLGYSGCSSSNKVESYKLADIRLTGGRDAPNPPNPTLPPSGSLVPCESVGAPSLGVMGRACISSSHTPRGKGSRREKVVPEWAAPDCRSLHQRIREEGDILDRRLGKGRPLQAEITLGFSFPS